MGVFYLILGIILALLVAVFAVQNAVPVQVTFLAWSAETSLVLVILGAAAVGAVCVGVLGLFKQMGLTFRLWGTQSRSRRYEGEVAQLRRERDRLRAEAGRISRENEQLSRELARLTAELAAGSRTTEPPAGESDGDASDGDDADGRAVHTD